MSGSPYEPDGADIVLADFGTDVVCAAVPAVNRALVEDSVFEREHNGAQVAVQGTLLKVKRGAFGNTAVQDTIVQVTARSASYRIDAPVPHPPSLFDWYALSPVQRT